MRVLPLALCSLMLSCPLAAETPHSPPPPGLQKALAQATSTQVFSLDPFLKDRRGPRFHDVLVLGQAQLDAKEARAFCQELLRRSKPAPPEETMVARFGLTVGPYELLIDISALAGIPDCGEVFDHQGKRLARFGLADGMKQVSRAILTRHKLPLEGWQQEGDRWTFDGGPSLRIPSVLNAGHGTLDSELEVSWNDDAAARRLDDEKRRSTMKPLGTVVVDSNGRKETLILRVIEPKSLMYRIHGWLPSTPTQLSADGKTLVLKGEHSLLELAAAVDAIPPRRDLPPSRSIHLEIQAFNDQPPAPGEKAQGLTAERRCADVVAEDLKFRKVAYTAASRPGFQIARLATSLSSDSRGPTELGVGVMTGQGWALYFRWDASEGVQHADAIEKILTSVVFLPSP